MQAVKIAKAGRGSKVHMGSFGLGASAYCMNNSFNGRLGSEIAVVESENLDAAIVAWVAANGNQFDLCGKCFKGVAA